MTFSKKRILFNNSSSINYVYEEMERLDNLFRSVHKRAPNVELFISTEWNNNQPIYSLSIYFDPSNVLDADYLIYQAANNSNN